MEESQNSDVEELSLSFNNLVDKDLNLFFTFGFEIDLESPNNNYFNSSINCLINIKTLSNFLLQQPANNSYIDLIAQMKIEKDKNKTEQNLNLIKEKFITLKNQIFNKTKNIKNQNPRQLIEFLIKSIDKDIGIPLEMKTKFNKICSVCPEKLQIQLNLFNFNIPEIIKHIKDNNIKKITLNECFDYYFNSLNKDRIFICDNCNSKNIKVSINKLPDILIIFIDYGKDKNICYDIPFKFEEEIDFNNFNYLSNEDKKRKYFLSSIIACKNIGTYFEIFFTFSRMEMGNKNYVLYNGSEVRQNLGVNYILNKPNINFKNKKESYPFVLVYNKNEDIK